MKIILFALSLITISVAAHADLAPATPILGTLTQAPSLLTFKLENGKSIVLKTPTSTKIVYRILGDKKTDSALLSWGRVSSSIFDTKCPRHLGLNEAPFAVEFQAMDSESHIITQKVEIAVGQVKFYGDCSKAENELTGLSINTTNEFLNFK